jgi:hypothetical protein
MYTFYSSVCNLLAPKPKIKEREIPQSVKLCDYDYITTKNEANETVILEVPKKPKYRSYF